MDGWFFPFGMSGEAIYNNFRDGAGPSGLAQGAASIRDLIKNYEQRAESITKLTEKMESAWQGDAAGAARRGAGPLAVEHGLAAPEMNTAQTLVTSQVSAYDRASAAVVQIPPTPEEPGLWDNITSLGGAGRTYESKMAEVTAANDHNVSVMNSYEDTTSTNTSGMPRSYGSISPDFSAVGVTPTETPPTPPPGRSDPPQTGDPNQSGDPNKPQGILRPPNPNQQQPNNPNDPNNPNNTGGQNGSGQTNPDQFIPQPVPPGPGPGPGQNPGQGPGHGPAPGFGPFIPGGGFGPTGGGGGGGTGTGPGGPGGGRGGVPAGARGGFGGGAAGGFGDEGGRSGARGLGAGGAAAAEAAAARGGGLGGGGRAGGMPMGGGHGNRGQGSEDGEHQRPSFLVEADPDETFGTDEITAPPVIGE
jgi:hypothetical protein